MADDPAEYLRETAALMRERAEAAREFPTQRWLMDQSDDDGLVVGQFVPDDVDDVGVVSSGCIAYFAYPGDEQRRTYSGASNVAAHMAAWDPTTALTVAAWLDHAADYVTPDPHSEDELCPDCAHVRAAMAVARTWRRDSDA